MKTCAVLAVVLALTASSCFAQSLDECLQKDSISCIQKSIFRKAKELLQKDSYEIVSGVSLVKSDRSARSADNLAAEQEIEKADSVAERQSAIENYVGGEVANFLTGRSLRVNFAPAMEKIGSAARALSDSIPAEIREVADDVVEGRNKKKHMLKRFLPLIALAKAKLGFLAVLGYFALALIAKKAIFISLVSIALSAFVGLRGLFSRGMGHVVESAPWGASGPSGAYSSGAAAWAPAPAAANSWSSNGPSHGWEDGHAAQSQAYSGYTQ